MSKLLSMLMKSKDVGELYETKILSQANASKGWAYQCKSTRQDIAKASVPTVYSDIKEKYDNSDEAIGSLYQGSNLKDNENNTHDWSVDNFGLCVFGDTTFALFGDTFIYYSSSYKSGATWYLLSSAESFTGMFKANNCIIVTSANSVYKLNPTTKTLTKIGNNIDSEYELSYKRVIFKVINGVIYLIKKSTNETTGTIYKRIYYVADDTTTNTLSYIGNYSRVVCDLEYINNNWYLLARNGYTFYVYKGTDLNNKTLTDTTKWEQKLSYHNSDWEFERNGEIFYANGRTVVFFKRYQANYDYVYTDNDFSTTNVITQISLGADDFCPLYFFNNVFYSIYKPTTTPYLFSCNIDDISSSSNWDYDHTVTPSPLVVDSNLIGLFLSNTLQLMAINLPSGSYRDFIYYRENEKIIYTDTYSIDNNDVVINYYKNNDFKICLSDNGGTNDTNLATVYSSLGYYDYFVLDLTNETISLPRKSDLYAVMYVGDNYQDTYSSGTPYLESDGSAWCNMSNNSITYTKWEIDCAVDNSLFDSGWNLVFGYTQQSNIYGAGYNGNTGVYGGFNGSATSPKNTYTKTTDRQVISTTLNSAKTTSSYYLPLFGKYDPTFDTRQAYKMKIYSAKFYNGDTLVIDLVPKMVNGVAGMYDNISGDFFTNRGSGSFTYGEE